MLKPEFDFLTYIIYGNLMSLITFNSILNYFSR